MAMVAKFKLILAGIGAVLLMLLGAFFKGRSSGKEEVKNEVQADVNRKIEEVAETRQANNQVVKDVQKEAITHSDSVIDAELSDKWTRG